jgi:hypothetical protein
MIEKVRNVPSSQKEDNLSFFLRGNLWALFVIRAPFAFSPVDIVGIINTASLVHGIISRDFALGGNVYHFCYRCN